MTEAEAFAIVKWLQDRKGKTLKLNDKGIDMVCEALEKQIAKKVIVPPCNVCQKKYCDPMCGYVSKSFVDDFKCPTCGSDRVYITEYGVMHDYCPNCGQKLDWSEV